MNCDDINLMAKELFGAYDEDEQIESLKKDLISSRKENQLLEEKAQKYFKYSIAISIVVVLLCIITGISCYKIAYKKGFKDNQPYSLDGSPTVYITPSGTKYHHKYCDYINGSKLTLSQKEAKEEGYGPCSRCMP